MYAVSSPLRPELVDVITYGWLFLIGASWVARRCYLATKGRLRLWSVSLAPCLIAVALTAGTGTLEAIGLPAAGRFDLSRSSLEQSAARARAGVAVSPGYIGLTPVDRVVQDEDGTTLFFVSDAGGILQKCGLAFNAAARPNLEDRGSGSIGAYRPNEGWWLFCQDA
jgi:hypothetical protein